MLSHVLQESIRLLVSAQSSSPRTSVSEFWGWLYFPLKFHQLVSFIIRGHLLDVPSVSGLLTLWTAQIVLFTIFVASSH